MKKLYIIALFLVFAQLGFAQQQPNYNQYALNPLTINPAYAGTNGAMNFTASYRQQWVAIDGAPQTFTFSGHMPLEGIKSGVGLLIVSDKVGSVNQTGISGHYSYKVNFDFGVLSAGLSMGVNQLRTDYANAFLNGVVDPTFATGDVNQWKFNSGFGLMLSGENYYAGFSIPQMLNNQFSNDNGVNQVQTKQQYYITGGYIFHLGDSKFALKPFALLRMEAGSPFDYDINIQAYYNELIGVGIQYRSNNSTAAILELAINKSIYFGYSYEFTYGNNFEGINTNGSHEFVLSYLIPWSGDKESKFKYY